MTNPKLFDKIIKALDKEFSNKPYTDKRIAMDLFVKDRVGKAMANNEIIKLTNKWYNDRQAKK